VGDHRQSVIETWVAYYILNIAKLQNSTFPPQFFLLSLMTLFISDFCWSQKVRPESRQAWNPIYLQCTVISTLILQGTLFCTVISLTGKNHEKISGENFGRNLYFPKILRQIILKFFTNKNHIFSKFCGKYRIFPKNVPIIFPSALKVKIENTLQNIWIHKGPFTYYIFCAYSRGLLYMIGVFQGYSAHSITIHQLCTEKQILYPQKNIL